MTRRSIEYRQLLAQLQPALENLDELRFRALTGITVTVSLFSTAWFGLWLVFRAGFDNDLRLLILPIILVSAGAHWFFTQTLRKQYKTQVVRRFVHLINDSFTYAPNTTISRAEYENSGLFKKICEHYRGDDYVKGVVGDTHLEFSELHTTYTTGSGKNRRTVTIFRGLFAVAEFHKQFHGTTYILPDVAESNFGWVGQHLQSANKSHGELIKLEDPEFEQHFVVYGTDQIEARYLLSTSMMSRMTEYRKKANVDVSFAFKDSKLYVAIHHNRPLFEPGLFTSYIEPGALDSTMDDLKLITGIVDDLNLNLDIWNHPDATRKIAM